MKRLAEFVVNKRIYFLVFFMIVTVISAVLVPMVKVNYDNTKYLPEDMETKQALSVMEEEFGRKGSVRVMVSDVSIPEALEKKGQIENIAGVEGVIWLDDVVDVRTPLNFLPESVVGEYYSGTHALFQVTFAEDDHRDRKSVV